MKGAIGFGETWEQWQKSSASARGFGKDRKRSRRASGTYELSHRTGTCRVVGGGVRTCVMLCDRVVSAGDPGSAMSASQAL